MDSVNGLAACAAYGLPSSHRLPREPMSGSAFAALLAHAEHHRLVGFLGAAARDGALVLDEEQRAALEESLEAWLAHSLRIEGLLLEAAEALERAGVQYRVFKGVALARTVYLDPAVRVFADADVLVRSTDFARATGILESELGVRRALPELRPDFDTRFGKEALLRSSTDLELDIHRTFVEGGLGLTVQLDDLFAAARYLTLGDRSLPALPSPQQLVGCCYAAALGDWPSRLASLRDVVQLLKVDCPSTADVLALAHRWRAEAVVAHGLCSAWAALVPLFEPQLVEWARGFRPRAIDRLILASYRGPARAFTRHASALVVVAGFRSKFAYLRAIALPQRAYLEQRGLSRGSHWRRALSRIRRRG